MPDVPEINKSLGELEEELQNLKTATEFIKDAKDTAEVTISESKKTFTELIKKSSDATDKTISESKKLNKSAKLLFDAVNDLTNRMDNVDFPIRLDKIDSTISGTNSSIQNIIGRLDSLERNLKDDFNSRLSAIEKELISIEEMVNKKMNRFQVFLIPLVFITSVILVIGFIYALIKL